MTQELKLIKDFNRIFEGHKDAYSDQIRESFVILLLTLITPVNCPICREESFPLPLHGNLAGYCQGCLHEYKEFIPLASIN